MKTEEVELLKHIKRKTVGCFQLSEDNMEKLKGIFPEKSNNEKFSHIKHKDISNYVPYLIMDDRTFIRGFNFNNNGMACALPLANPVLIYFHFAQATLKDTLLLRKELLDLFKNNTIAVDGEPLKLFYNFFGIASTFVVMLVTSLEAFVNSKIDKDFLYRKKDGNKCVKVYDYEQIQRWISYEEKVTKILNKTTNKNFAKNYPLCQKQIDELLKLRNEVIHTKTDNTYDYYEHLYTDMLSFKFNETIIAVRDFINYYEENLIEQCPCKANS